MIKKADKGSCVVVWDREDYLLEAQKQLQDKNVYKKMHFNETLIQDLTETSKKMFRNLKNEGFLSDKELKYFIFEHKKACNLGKLYFLPKIHKRLENVPGRPVISNCGTATEKASEFLDSYLKPIMQESWSYIKDSGDFIQKIKSITNIPENSILVTADVVGLYPSIPHAEGLNALKNVLDRRAQNLIPTEKLLNFAEFVLKNNYFEFDGQTMQQISGTAIGTKCAPAYACIFMDHIETEFLKVQTNKPLTWFRYIDDIFFIWTHGKTELELFLQNLNHFNSNLKFTYALSEENVSFLDLKVKLSNGRISTDLFVKPIDRHQYLHYTSSHPNHTKRSIVYSQGLRVQRICTEKNDFLGHMEEMKSWFLRRGYPKDLIETEQNKVYIPSKSKIEIFDVVQQGNRNTRFSYLKIRQPFRKTNMGQKSISYTCPGEWNKLPNNLKSCENANTFKHQIKKLFLNLLK